MENPLQAVLEPMRTLVNNKLAEESFPYKALVHNCSWEDEEAYINWRTSQHRFHDVMDLNGRRVTVMEFYKGVPLCLRTMKEFEFVRV